MNFFFKNVIFNEDIHFGKKKNSLMNKIIKGVMILVTGLEKHDGCICRMAQLERKLF